ncbi:MAG: DUF1592 domain-containing protein, partial [Myxococcota bacterium]
EQPGPEQPGPEQPGASACASVTLPVDKPRRLNIDELNTIARDVLQLTDRPFSVIGNDYGERVGSFLGTSERFLTEYFDVAEAIAAQYVEQQNLTDRCDAPTAACAAQVLRPIAEQLLGHPITDGDADALGAFVGSASDLELSFADGLAAGLTSILVSPDFLIVGTEAEAQAGVYALSGYAKAERLALALWNSVPDEPLLAAATDGSLDTADGLETQVRRMLADTQKGGRFLDSFVETHFDLPSGNAVPLGLEPLGAEGGRLANDMRTEAQMLIQSAFEQNMPLERLVSGNTTFMNERLAAYYGIDGVSGDDFVEVSTEGTPRVGGLLTSGAVLAQEGDLIHRGVNVLQSYLCQTFVAPDPEIIEQALAELPADATVREEVTFRTRDGCRGCHASIDPLGAAFEIFDDAGQMRDQYPNGDSVVYASEFNGQTIRGPADVTQMVVDGAFRKCLTSQVLGWVSFRRLSINTRKDRCATESLLTSVGDQAKFKDIVVKAFLSDTFTHRVVD